MKTIPGETVLEIKDLHFSYPGGEKLYNGFDLKVEKGECVSIVGESGSGKSTLFEIIAGNLKAERGTVRKKSISWVFQDPYTSFHPSYTVMDQIEDVVKDFDDMENYLFSLSLREELLGKLPHELSGGQLQRCSIFRALLMKPDLLLCDEPTSALDNITQLETMKLLMGFLDRLGILLITHDMTLAKWSSDRVVSIGAQVQKHLALRSGVKDADRLSLSRDKRI